ncbi:hypothetical protein CRE_06127 [Caenorhabditis remanei]|uniref:F-box domain-containing protein n=1 Tax=Caenorhabditis remanei TaxID=31234 RepID=E3NEB3_CAERE|nr:hypothetical protein CRE_06127 [Caenorhabditis remanei]
MERSFPLFRLPENAIIKVFKNLCLGQLFFISLVSTKTKKLVTSLGLRADFVKISISKLLHVSLDIGRSHFNLMLYNYTNDPNGELPGDITLPVEIQKVFIQNLNCILFDDVYSLDDMLLVNSEKVKFIRPISQKQFNRFVKHWIRGSNPRLQDMSLAIDKIDFPSGELYLNGIRCTAMEEKAKQEIRENYSLSVNADMVQVRRKDGTPTVVVTKDSENVLYVRFIVLY